MKRRKAIKDLLVASGGTLTLPFWMQSCGHGDQDRYSVMLTAVVDTIIPDGRSGARSGPGGGSSGPGGGTKEPGSGMSGPGGGSKGPGGVERGGTSGPGGGSSGPGAVSLGVDRYVKSMIADCYERPVQENVRRQLAALEGNGFGSSTRQAREAMLLKLAGSADKAEKDFFTLMKQETIRGYDTSKRIMEDYFHYTIAPGHYYGCVAVNG